MPTRYAARANLKPFDLDAWLENPYEQLQQDTKGMCFECTLRDKLASHKEQLGIDLEDLNFEGLVAALFNFTANALALSTQGVRQLEPTVEVIRKTPEAFLERSEAYDPEAAALVIGECARCSPLNAHMVLGWELAVRTNSAHLLAKEMAQAADRVVEGFKKQIKNGLPRGRHAAKLQTDLAIELAKIFLAAGGKLKRNVLIGSAGETGPFHKFLQIALEPIRLVASHAGLPLTIETMVRKAINHFSR